VRKNISCPRAQGNLATPLTEDSPHGRFATHRLSVFATHRKIRHTSDYLTGTWLKWLQRPSRSW